MVYHYVYFYNHLRPPPNTHSNSFNLSRLIYKCIILVTCTYSLHFDESLIKSKAVHLRKILTKLTILCMK